MKNKLLIASLLALFFTANAQEQHKEKFTRPTNNAKDVYGGWYNFGSMIYDNLGGTDYFRNHLFPDSSVQVEYSNGFGHVWKHSMGQVFDPADDNWATGSIVPIDLTDPYTVDSVSIWYRYFRHQTAAPDTVRVQVITESNMSLYEDPWSSGISYATTEYDHTTHTAPNATQVFTILLDDDDTSTVAQRSLDLAIDQIVNPNEVMGVIVDYLPGNPYNFADTIDQYATTTPTNQINAFLMYNYRDNNQEFLTGFYNHGLLIPSSIRYDQNAQNWNGAYYPGTAYFNYVDHTDIDFHVVGTVGIEEENAISFGMHPNPAKETVRITTDFPISKEDIHISDISGKDVNTLVHYTNNTLHVAALSNGTYFIQIQHEGHVATQKLVIAH